MLNGLENIIDLIDFYFEQFLKFIIVHNIHKFNIVNELTNIKDY